MTTADPINWEFVIYTSVPWVAHDLADQLAEHIPTEVLRELAAVLTERYRAN